MHFAGHLPPRTRCDVQEFVGWASVADVDWRIWHKPEGVSMVSVVMLGSGGGGGSGVIGANSNAAGGGGGGSGGQSKLTVPAFLLPGILYVTAGAAKTGAGIASRLSIYPNITTNHLVLSANGGGAGGNGSGASAGAGGAAGTIQSIGQNPFCGLGAPDFLVGSAGAAGGTTGGSSALTLPLTGLVCTGGTGGAGLSGAGANGQGAGQINTPASPTPFPTHPFTPGTTSATVPPSNGSHGIRNFLNGLLFGYGGLGGAATHGSATGAGAVQARGGDGVGYGCGGGGMGGALTGSTPAELSKGGPGYVLIVAW